MSFTKCPRCNSRNSRKNKRDMRSDAVFVASSRKALVRLCAGCSDSLLDWFVGDGLPLGDERDALAKKPLNPTLEGM